MNLIPTFQESVWSPPVSLGQLTARLEWDAQRGDESEIGQSIVEVTTFLENSEIDDDQDFQQAKEEIQRVTGMISALIVAQVGKEYPGYIRMLGLYRARLAQFLD
jgi:hypothetical protein